ncbi:molybdenum cofactor guanylyltransferase MobA [Vibrio marisflavi]|uniref:Molybdenum cofactor guanylyltransferase n=1 Tax=Vibrio marisflavi CECT 7928 TaxID=634439 RepID=A0ABN8E7C5_9VIBR|nr:molybdenum cofactor guanylyltransferase MobA [Vibrio marisflavi]CAH0539889.1 Molybdenum cofactor guanylyltransferase [Vibrio marisflavi CECT 7928]
MIPIETTSWVILAGGQASRMNGNDKGLIELNKKTLVEHAIEILAVQTDRYSINANRNLDTYQKFAPVIKDEITGFQGPLAGIHAGLANSKTEWVGFVPCDCPFIVGDLVERFCNDVSESNLIYVAHDGEHVQPIFSLWNIKVLDALEDYLKRGERKVGFFYKEMNAKPVDFSDTPKSFVNLNTPEDLKQFEKAEL